MDTEYKLIDPAGNACVSHCPYGGYSYETLKDMLDNGFTLEINGKKAKMPTRAEHADAIAAAKKAK